MTGLRRPSLLHRGHADASANLVVGSFVDKTRYCGTCYRAYGYAAVGPTAGFGRASRDFYHEQGFPRQL